MSAYRPLPTPELPGAVAGTSYQVISGERPDLLSEDFESLMMQAEFLRRTGSIEESCRAYNHAVERAKGMSDAVWVRAVWAKSNLQRQLGQHNASLETLIHARELTRRSGDARMKAAIAAGMAEVHRIEGRYDQAWKEHTALEQFFRDTRDARGILWAIQGRAQILCRSARWQEARLLFGASLPIAMDSVDIRSCSFARRGIGDSLLGMGRMDEAQAMYGVAMEGFATIGYKIGMGYTLRSIARLHLKVGNFAHAILCIDRAIRLFWEARHPRGLKWSRRTLQDIFMAVDRSTEGGTIQGLLLAGMLLNFRQDIGAKLRDS